MIGKHISLFIYINMHRNKNNILLLFDTRVIDIYTSVINFGEMSVVRLIFNRLEASEKFFVDPSNINTSSIYYLYVLFIAKMLNFTIFIIFYYFISLHLQPCIPNSYPSIIFWNILCTLFYILPKLYHDM